MKKQKNKNRKFIKKIVVSLTLFMIIFSGISLFQNSYYYIAEAQSGLEEVLPPTFDMDEPGPATTTDYIKSLPGAQQENVTWQQVLGRIIYYALIIVNILTIGSFIAAGVFMVIAHNDEQTLTKAKRIFYYTILAALFAIAALGIVRSIFETQFF